MLWIGASFLFRASRIQHECGWPGATSDVPYPTQRKEEGHIMARRMHMQKTHRSHGGGGNGDSDPDPRFSAAKVDSAKKASDSAARWLRENK